MTPTDRDLEELALKLGRALHVRGWRLSAAESCTGGWIAKVLTDVAGSSQWFEGGVVAYSNRSKEELLGVPESVLRAHGAASAACAEAMARGIAARAGASCGLANVGIAGPDGGTPSKPVGTVFVGLVVAGESFARRFHCGGDRAAVKWQATQAALDLLRRSLRDGR